MNMNQFIDEIPQAELHANVEGSLSSELQYRLGERNRIEGRRASIEELDECRNFADHVTTDFDLVAFMEFYVESLKVFATEQDFYEVTYGYLIELNNFAKQQDMFEA